MPAEVEDSRVEAVAHVDGLAILEVAVEVLVALRIGRLRVLLAPNHVLAQAAACRTPAARRREDGLEGELAAMQPGVRQVDAQAVHALRRLGPAAWDMEFHLPRLPRMCCRKRRERESLSP